MIRIFLLIYLILIAHLGFASDHQHPRALIDSADVEKMRERIKRQPWLPAFENLKTSLASFESNTGEQSDYDLENLALSHAMMHVLTGEKHHAEQSYKFIKQLQSTTDVFTNVLYRGLNKAYVLRGIALSYDFCYNAWSNEQRKEVNQMIWDLMVSVSSTMGFQANTHTESNWMGVRWASVMLAAIVWDDFENERNSALPFLWDNSKRLQDHIRINIHDNGWNGESMNYFGYNWSFIAPAIIAMQNRYRDNEENPASLSEFAPNAQNAFWAKSVIAVPVLGNQVPCIQNDFSVDDVRCSQGLTLLALKLLPEDQKRYMQWLTDFFFDFQEYQHNFRDAFYFIAWYDDQITPENPTKAGWNTYHDPDMGIVIFRNHFKNEKDIVAGFNAVSKRIRGHGSYDNLGFRIVGLGNIWAIGAGRTGKVAGQTSLFPRADIDTLQGISKFVSSLDDYRFEPDGSGFAKGRGNCMGIENHHRFFQVDYSGESGAEGVFVVKEDFDGEAIWRMNTPEFNDFEKTSDGFMLTAPNGSTLKVHAYSEKPLYLSETTLVRYGSQAGRLNPGICFMGECYENSMAIDFMCEEKIVVVMSLQPAGKDHPEIRFSPAGFTMGGKNYIWD